MVGMKECAQAALDIAAILEKLTGDEPRFVLDLVLKSGGYRPVQIRGRTGADVGANEPSDRVQTGFNEPVQIGSKAVHLHKRWSSSFLVFWSLYPKKTGKQEALRVWNRIQQPSQELLDRILQSVREQKTSEDWTKEGGRFIPHPKTWLNQGRWDDEPTEQMHQGSLLSERTRGNADAARSFVERMHDRDRGQRGGDG